MHTQCGHDRKEDRREDQYGRSHIHECADDEQQHIDQKEDHDRVIG